METAGECRVPRRGVSRRVGLLRGALLQKESLIGLPETLHERSPPALGILLVPHRTPLFLPQSERHLLSFAIILAFCTLVGMPGVGDGIDLFDRVCRRMLAKSTANDDVIVAGLCWCQWATPYLSSCSVASTRHGLRIAGKLRWAAMSANPPPRDHSAGPERSPDLTSAQDLRDDTAPTKHAAAPNRAPMASQCHIKGAARVL